MCAPSNILFPPLFCFPHFLPIFWRGRDQRLTDCQFCSPFANEHVKIFLIVILKRLKILQYCMKQIFTLCSHFKLLVFYERERERWEQTVHGFRRRLLRPPSGSVSGPGRRASEPRDDRVAGAGETSTPAQARHKHRVQVAWRRQTMRPGAPPCNLAPRSRRPSGRRQPTFLSCRGGEKALELQHVISRNETEA